MSSPATLERMFLELQKDVDKHADDISSTKKAVTQIEKTLIKIEGPVSVLVKLMWFISLGVVASIGAAVWQVIAVHGKTIIPL